MCPSCGQAVPSAKPRRPWFAVAVAVAACLAAGVVVVLVAVGLGYDVRAASRRFLRFGKSDPPVYQWVQSEDKTFSFLPGEGKAWGPVEPQDGEIHYVIHAFLPVDTGLMESDKWTDSMEGWRVMQTSSICYASKIKSSSKVCHTPTGKPYLIFIRDPRAKQFGLGGLSTGVLNTKMLQEQNSVTVTLFTRKCLENCS